MSIEKKSLISTLKTTRKANVAKEDFGQAGAVNAGMKSPAKVAAGKHAPGKLQAGKHAPGRRA